MSASVRMPTSNYPTLRIRILGITVDVVYYIYKLLLYYYIYKNYYYYDDDYYYYYNIYILLLYIIIIVIIIIVIIDIFIYLHLFIDVVLLQTWAVKHFLGTITFQ